MRMIRPLAFASVAQSLVLPLRNRSAMSMSMRLLATTPFSPLSSSQTPTPSPTSVQIFCDLDGVLCDFDKGVRSIFDGHPPEQVPPKVMWPKLAKARPGFYSALEWTSDGEELWNAIKDEDVTVLTGVPRGGWGAIQKLFWCKVSLGKETPGGEASKQASTQAIKQASTQASTQAIELASNPSKQPSKQPNKQPNTQPNNQSENSPHPHNPTHFRLTPLSFHFHDKNTNT